ncbi:CaiB/BaiF CoA transferase family protein [Kyrpidia tusciae]|uniref:L-carnitine dehydratase/bile acid-inducible protein F n=1 Tax=Kyrpidia tusciae (strain DSM 2912 / NBRC 15312 / T2) TaxID=562970 RepID=D5WXT5_KYRT2|nr:CoA transferase [Kyrpidia tusciae]ADG05994.1 L-carnitine dehydratase/bile acid-inducible protein F [Kyrpidia tusciae DSM 2912]
MTTDKGNGAKGPLTGLRILDFTTNISGPSATAILADLGADVIKIERVSKGDDARHMSPQWNGESAYFLAINRNKRSMALDFTKPEGREIILKLVARSDVVVENFRKGVLEKYGLDSVTLVRQYPSLVYCSLTAYGEAGKDQWKPGYDAVLQARTGIMSITGSREEEPSRAGVSILDAGSAMWAAVGILSALFHRERTGRGQIVGTSLFETGIYWMNYHLTSYQATNRDPVPQGARHMAFAPYGTFQTADDLILIGISNDVLFEKLTEAMGCAELASDPRFAHNPDRVANREELEQILSARFRQYPSAVWIERLEAAGIPCSPVQKVSRVYRDPQTEALDMLQKVQHPHIPELRIPRLPVRLTETPAEIRSPAPLLGQHTRVILEEIGESHRLQELVDKGVVGV